MPMERPVQNTPNDPAAGPDGSVQDGGRAALVSQLFEEHNSALIGFLLTRVNSEQEARDVAQEAYVRMLELDTPGAVSFLRAYLFKTAANLATDRARQRASQTRVHERWIDPFQTPKHTPSPEGQAGARQELELLRHFMEELPPRCREAFYLHRFRDMSVPDIAQRLSVSERMVRKYVVRAFVHCRQRLNAAREGVAR